MSSILWSYIVQGSLKICGTFSSLEGGAGHKGFAAVSGDLGADVGHAGDGGLVGGDAAQPHGNVLIHPVALLGGGHIAVPVQMAQVGG